MRKIQIEKIRKNLLKNAENNTGDLLENFIDDKIKIIKQYVYDIEFTKITLTKFDPALLRIGDAIDAKDKDNTWYSAYVIFKFDGYIKVHFSNWSSVHDETICFDSHKIAPAGTFVYNGNNNFQIDMIIDVFDTHPACNKWSSARIIDINEDNIKVHFKGYTEEFDEWILKKSDRVRPFTNFLSYQYLKY